MEQKWSKRKPSTDGLQLLAAAMTILMTDYCGTTRSAGEVVMTPPRRTSC
jgi:hypothetical protein